MSDEIPERVTCEVCGTSFDPAESRGWCPNAACGKWQHPAFPLSNDQGESRVGADGGVNTPTKVCPSCGKDVRADANFCKFCSHEFPDDAQGEPAGGAGGSEPGIDECPGCGADLSSIPPERLADCPICGMDLGDVLTDRSEPDVTPADLTNCPACAADLTDIPEDMRMVCPDCRVDLREAIETHGADGDGAAGAQAGGEAAGGGAGGAAGGGTGGAAGGQAGGGQPADGQAAGGAAGGGQGGGGPDEGQASVDTIKGIGASYAERLGNAGIETVADLVLADPRQLSAATDISEKRLGEWVERAPVDPADLGQRTGAGATADADGAAAGQAGGGQAGGGQAGGGQAGGTAGGQTGGAAGGQASGQGDAGGQQAGGRRTGQQTGGQQTGGQQTGGQQTGGQQTGGQGAGGANTGGNSSNAPNVPNAPSTGRGGAGGTGPAHDAGAGTPAQPHYDTVVLTVMGQEIRARPGDTLGREIRTAMVESGAPDDDAVYIHREHLRVDEEDNRFYFTRLGQNSLKVNDQPVAQGERAEVNDGDVVSFSEVVSADVRLE